MKILTFNHHESYICSLAETGHQFDVVVRYKKLDLAWSPHQRRSPPNVRTVIFDQSIKSALNRNEYDVVICHTVKNLIWLFGYQKPTYIFIAHIPLFFYSPGLLFKSIGKKAIFKIFKWTHRVHFFAVSEFKRKMWHEKGTVARLAPQVFLPITPETGYQQVIVVVNQLKERRKELGYDYIEPLLTQFPIQVIGDNPGVPGSIKPANFAEFQTLFRAARIYLYTIRYPFGDGYNTAMLEAMSMGMAVVTLANPSSPICHQVNGLVANDIEELKQHLSYLLLNPGDVDRLGAAAKQTVAEQFSQELFLQGWQDLLSRI